jgi:DNA-binding XRE family transcriptional regulator
MESKPKSMATDAAGEEGERGDGHAPAKGGASHPGSQQPTKRASGRAGRVSSRRSAKAQVPSGKPKSATNKAAGKAAKPINGVRAARIERMMSKAELARRAGLSVLTIDRVEKDLECRMDTKRKILEALGLGLQDRVRVFGEEE